VLEGLGDSLADGLEGPPVDSDEVDLEGRHGFACFLFYDFLVISSPCCLQRAAGKAKPIGVRRWSGATERIPWVADSIAPKTVRDWGMSVLMTASIWT
jgi:hypothetical protein